MERPEERTPDPWRFVPPVLLAAIGVAMLVWTWGTWLHPLIDFGRELYVPWRITKGDVLFRDIAWFNGPLSQYVNATVFAVFGVGLRTLVIFNALLLTGVTILLYRLARELSDRFTATLACALFLFVFCFGQLDQVANFNWICPYSHELTHGVALGIVAVCASTRWLRGGGPRWVVVAGAANGLCALTKPEALLASGGAVLVAFALGWRADRARTLRAVPRFAVSAAVPPGVALLLLATAMPIADAARGVLGGWPHVFNSELASNRFYQACFGTDAPAVRLQAIAVWGGVWLAVLGAIAGLGLALRWRGRSRLAVAAVFAVVLFLAGDRPGIAWHLAWTPLPIALAAVAAAAVRAHLRTGAGATAVVLCAFSATLLLKILLHARVYHYGFALAAPATLLCVVALFAWLPPAIDRWGGCGQAIRVAGLGLVGVIVFGHGRKFAHYIDEFSHPIASGADAFTCDIRADIYNELLRSFAGMPADNTFVVLPEGIMLNYLARQRNPTGFVNYMPPEIIMFGEDRILASLKASPPDQIVLVHRSTVEYALPLFGIHYAQRIMQWVRANYVPVNPTGPQPLHPDRLRDELWGLWVLQRKL